MKLNHSRVKGRDLGTSRRVFEKVSVENLLNCFYFFRILTSDMKRGGTFIYIIIMIIIMIIIIIIIIVIMTTTTEGLLSVKRGGIFVRHIVT